MKRLYSLLYRLAVLCGSNNPTEDAYYGLYSWDTGMSLEEMLDGSEGRYRKLIEEILVII